MKKIILFILAVVYYSASTKGQDPNLEYPYQFTADGNPIITHMRTADPSCKVWQDGRLWMYASHDPDNAGNNYDGMDGYHVFSTIDLVNWVDHGEVLHSRDVEWNGIGSMWAPDCAYKNGKYYFYFPSKMNGTNFRTGVAISDKPEGPFIPEPNFIEGTTGIDPMCFIDDDGQAYLYFGYTGNPFVAKLKDNMIELAEEMRRIDIGTDPNAYVEGTFVHKHNGKYYMSWSNYKGWSWNGKQYGALYGIGDSPYGPFEFKGGIKENPPGAQDHHSIVKYHGKSYIFYHVGNYNGGNNWKRNSCVDYLHYNNDGTIQIVDRYNQDGVDIDSVGIVDALIVPGKHKADTFYNASGISGNNTGIQSVNNGDYVEYVIEVLGTAPYELTFIFDTVFQEGSIQVSINNDSVASANVETTTKKSKLTFDLHKGRHLLKFGFFTDNVGNDLLKLDSLSLFSGYQYYKVTSEAGTGGEISPSESNYYKEGSEISYTIKSLPGFLINDVQVNGESQGKISEYTFKNLSGNASISASFVACNNTVSIETQVGFNEPTSATQIEAEFESKVTITADTGEGTYLWDGKQVNSTSNSISFTADGNHFGDYTLLFTSNNGCTTEHTVNIDVVVNAYQCEDYEAESGTKIENCSDFKGGEQLGYIQNGDWSTYSIDVPETGKYSFKCRVAAPSNGSVKLYSNNTHKATATVAETGGWHNWVTTEPVTLSLNKGVQNIKLLYQGGGGFLFNINWFKLDFMDPSHIINKLDVEKIDIYPNPAKNNFTVNFGEYINAEIYLFTADGHKVYSNKIAGRHSHNIRTTEFPAGIYFLIIGAGNTVISKKVMIE